MKKGRFKVFLLELGPIRRPRSHLRYPRPRRGHGRSGWNGCDRKKGVSRG